MELSNHNTSFVEALNDGNIIWRKHVLEKMMSRNITRAEVLNVLEFGEVIQRYDYDKPFPSMLILGFPFLRPLHVVASFDQENGVIFLITAYEPDIQIFEDDLKTKRK